MQTIRGLLQKISTILKPLMSEALTPRQGAAAVFVGVFIAHIPIYGFQAIVAAGLAVALKLNKPLTVTATFINNPLLQPILIVAAVEAGNLTLHGSLLSLSPADVLAMSPGEHLWTWLFGSLLLGVLLGVLLAGGAYAVLSLRPTKREAAVRSLYSPCSYFDRGFVRWKLRLDRIFGVIAPEVPGSGRVVDLGCGYGITLAWVGVEAPNRPLAGCDLSAARIETARKALANHSAAIVVADVREFQFDEADLILIMDVLQYLNPGEQAVLLERSAAALIPGGKLVFRVHDWEDGIRSRLVMAFDRLILFCGGARRRPTTLPAGNYRDILARAGLSVRERRFRNLLPLAHILFVAQKRSLEEAPS